MNRGLRGRGGGCSDVILSARVFVGITSCSAGNCIVTSCLTVASNMFFSMHCITRYVAFQTLKATTAKARLNSSLARLICAAMVAFVGSASLFD